MPTYYDHGLGIDDPTQITETGDELASAANYIEPENVDYAHYTWENQPVSEYVTRLIRDSDHPQLSSPLIYITIPSGSPHYIYDSTNTVLISGNADENNDREFTLDYQLTGASADTGDITNTTAWSFTTSALEFGNTTVRTNIISDMGPRAYDSVIVSRTPTLPPVVTITTETSATTASEITIDGTASDPNDFNIVTVSYELSGARTDSGIATGTTIWTFTEGLSAGNNRFDVTAINDWTPPLSGSDFLIVTYSPPSQQYDQMFYDNFGDESLDPTWSVTGGTNVVEAGGYLTFNSAEDDGLEVSQTLTIDTDFDVYGQVELDTQNNTVITFNWRQSFLPSGLQSAELRLERNSGQYDIRYTFYDGAGSDTGTVDNIGQDNCWFRTRYSPSQGDTELRLFYSLTTPTIEGHWTEFSSPTRSVIPDPAELDPVFLMESVSDEFASSTQIIYDAIEWTG